MQTAFDYISNQVSPVTKNKNNSVLDPKQRDQLARIDQQLESIDTGININNENRSSLAVPDEEEGGDDYEPMPAAGILASHKSTSGHKKKVINPLYAEESDSDEYYDEEDET